MDGQLIGAVTPHGCPDLRIAIEDIVRNGSHPNIPPGQLGMIVSITGQEYNGTSYLAFGVLFTGNIQKTWVKLTQLDFEFIKHNNRLRPRLKKAS
jgi:hypothetical protein